MGVASSRKLFDKTGPFVSSCGPCLGKESWVGMHFDEPVEVQCVQLNIGECSDKLCPKHETATQFKLTPAVLDIQHNVDPKDPTNYLAKIRFKKAARLTGLKPSQCGVYSLSLWSDAANQGVMWRVRPTVDFLSSAPIWSIAEVEFHSNTACRSYIDGTPATPTSMCGQTPAAAFDRNEDTFWTASVPPRADIEAN